MTLKSPVLALALVVTLATAMGGCRRGPDAANGEGAPEAPFSAPTEAGSDRPSTPEDLADATATAKQTDPNTEAGSLVGEALNPTTPAVLTATDAQAEINVRAEPTTESDILGVGRVGDRITLLRNASGDDGYGWYYLSFQNTDTTGWVRGDFIDTQAPQQPTAENDAMEEDALAEALDGGCRGPENISHYYSTANYNIYICHVGGKVLYVGNEKGTPQVLLSEDVTAVRGTQANYVAVNGNYEYHIGPEELVVYRIDDSGDYSQLLQEQVTLAENY
jgi:hypothetical protein